TSRKIAIERIWKAIQSLGAAARKPAAEVPEPVAVPSAIIEPEANEEVATEAAKEPVATEQPGITTASKLPAAEPVAHVGAQAPDVAPVVPDPATTPTRAKKASKKPIQPKANGVRESSKTAQVVAMLQREGGATLAEIMNTMGWQKHTVRGFMAGAMKKAGYTVESFKPEGGERTYRINK